MKNCKLICSYRLKALDPASAATLISDAKFDFVVVNLPRLGEERSEHDTRTAENMAAIMQRQLSFEARLGRVPADIEMPLHIDNSATLNNATSDNIHISSRHMAIRIGIIRQAAREMLIKPMYVRTSMNIADALTKPVSRRNMLAFYPHVYGVP